MTNAPITLPRLTVLAKTAAPRILEAVVAPLAVFYAALTLLGETGAIMAAVTWVYGGIVYRWIRRQPVPATMFLAALAITARAVLGLWTGSGVGFFLPSELGTVVISFAFLASVRLRRPLVEKLTLDYIHLPAAVLRNERMRRFFARITLLWGFVLLANSAVSIWLLLEASLGSSYLLVRTGAVAVISGLAITFSIYAFRRVLRRLHAESRTRPAELTA
ncbi:VC0807 family protein [Sinosporangium siamense]|uniref:Intracellular septation protein A n=1 Tax=Sinosporangium siamense TaxID=1367973 RepID=A0A919RGE7_9ACTN|nr:VC0807 family protein [Sinosporangium siamense]GII91466.1 hypothetical protein Ssi02_16970 [Sinosporangium siamense]